MKKLNIFFFVLCMMGVKMAHAQVPYDTTKKKIIYTEVVQVQGADKGKLYDRAMVTLNDVYKNLAGKLTVKDKEKGQIVLNGYTKYTYTDKSGNEIVDPTPIKYKLVISFKDGKYKYEFYDFHIDRGGYPLPFEKYYDNDPVVAKDHPKEKLDFVDKDIRAIIAKLKEGLSQDKAEKKSDW